MHLLYSTLFLLTFFLGCNGEFNNQQQLQEPSLQITLSPAFAPTAVSTVAVNAQLILTASSALDPNSVNESTIYIEDSIGVVAPATITLVAQNIVIKPKEHLSETTNYTVIVSTAVRNMRGTYLSERVSIPFLTGSAVADTLAPNLIGQLAKGNSIITPETILFYQFDEPISPVGITDAVITVKNSIIGHTITGTTRVSGDLLIFEPNEPFKSTIPTDSAYIITLTFTGNIYDLAGNEQIQTEKIDSISVSEPLMTTQKPLHANQYNSNSTLYCIESATVDDTRTHLYTGGTNGLEIIDFNLDTKIFSKVAHIDSSLIGEVYSIDINASANRLYVGSSKGFSIYDTSNITQPTQISNYNTGYPVFGVDIVADHAYIAASSAGVYGLDINHETQPIFLFSDNNQSAIAFDVVHFNNELVIANYAKGISLYKTTGTFSESWPLPQTAHARQLLRHPDSNFRSDFLIASGIEGFRVFERDANTWYLAHFNTPSYVNKIATNNSFVFCNTLKIGIAQLSITDYSLSTEGYLVPKPFVNTVTFTEVHDRSATKQFLILVDDTGRLYSMAF